MRLFLAIALPEAVHHGLNRLVQRLRRECVGWRWVRPEGIHLTVRFLGEVDPVDDARLRQVWGRAVSDHPPFRLVLGGLGVFPSPRSPRVLWVGVEEQPSDGRLARLAAAVEGAARSSGFDPEERPFRAHLTLARTERGARSPTTPRREAPEVEGLAAEVSEVVLFASELGPAGARYTALERFPLGGPA